MKKGRVAVLLSGRGSNFEAIYQSSVTGNSNYEVCAVISDNPQAEGLKKAEAWHLPVFRLDPSRFSSSRMFSQRLIEVIDENRVDLICLAGYMRILGKSVVKRYSQRILNIHPSLLPSFPGLDAQQQALDYGVKFSGCTVHFVDRGMDTGPIVLQQAVPVMEGDDVASLSSRILCEEHRLFPRAVSLFFSGRLQLNGRRVTII